MGGYKYQLTESYAVSTGIRIKKPISNVYIKMNTRGKLTIHAGYAWDGPSGPCPDFKSTMRGSLVHDALYQFMRLGMLDRKHRNAADRLLYKHCRQDGLPRPLAWIVYKSVEKFAADYAKSKNRRKAITAP